MVEFIDFLIEEAFISITLLLLIILLIANIIFDKTKKYIDIEVNQAVDLMSNKDLIILDVREDKERINGFINNDTHMPLSSVKSRLNELDKNKKFLVYCRSGSRSAHICSTLTKADFQDVYNLKGGLNAWIKANLPINKAKNLK